MDPAVARLAATRIAKHADRHGLARVAVIVHGGGPLLLGAERLPPILTELRSTIGQVTDLDLSLQTNVVSMTRRLSGDQAADASALSSWLLYTKGGDFAKCGAVFGQSLGRRSGRRLVDPPNRPLY